MEINYAALGERIRKLRKAAGITQAQLGETAQVEPSNISHIERGATKVSLPTLLRIANALHASLDELIYDSLDNNRHISVNALNEALADCSDNELSAIVEMVKSTKRVLRNSREAKSEKPAER